MAKEKQDITFWKGDSGIIIITAVDESDVPLDLDGATARWWVGKAVGSTGDDVVVKKSTGDGIVLDVATDGTTLTVTLDPEDTEGLTPGGFYHECEVVDVDGNVSTITTGKFLLKPTLIPNGPES